jgi:hypothetical protein
VFMIKDLHRSWTSDSQRLVAKGGTADGWVVGILDAACATDLIICQQGPQRNLRTYSNAIEVRFLTSSNRGGDIFCGGFLPITRRFLRFAPCDMIPARSAALINPARIISRNLPSSVAASRGLCGFDHWA